MSKYSSKKPLGLFVITIFGIGLLAAAVAVQNSTEIRQHASVFNDLNSSAEIAETINADGTMGPATWGGNFSNQLPSVYLGTLDFQVTDPQQGVRPTEIPVLPTHAVIPTHAILTPTGKEDEENKKPSITPMQEGKDNQGGPQKVASLVLVIKKVEVHLARLGLPGTKNEDLNQPENHGEPTTTPGQKVQPTPMKDNQDVNKWETLNISVPLTVDLVALAKTHDFTSLGITKLANGRYTEIRLYIQEATATLADGTKATLTIPGKANIVRVVRSFVIDSSKKTTITMDFDAQNSVIKAGDIYLLKPVVANLLEKLQ